MTTEVRVRMEQIRCKGTDRKTGRPCRKILLEVWPEHRKMVLERIQIICADCHEVYKEQVDPILRVEPV